MALLSGTRRMIGRPAGRTPSQVLSQRRHASLQLLTSASCSLCEDMLDTLDAVRKEEAFELEEIDIRSPDVSHQLRRRFQYSIPVLMDGETVVAQTRLRADRLIEYLRERRQREVRRPPVSRADAVRPRRQKLAPRRQRAQTRPAQLCTSLTARDTHCEALPLHDHSYNSVQCPAQSSWT